MTVTIAAPGVADQREYVAAVRASLELHRPWLAPAATPAAYRAWLERAAAPDMEAYLIRHATCGRLVGYASLNNIVRRGFQSGALGYGAFFGHEGRGLMTAGLRLVLADIFGRLRLHRIEANIQPGNTRSLAMVRRLGFEREGLSRRMLFVDGAWRDHERWALLVDDARS